MKIVIDEKIPYIQKALEAMGHTVTAKAGNLISGTDVKDAGALFVRTRTMCNGALLDGSEVRFIGTATIGYDHIDAQYCKEKGIYWTSAPGCNAGGEPLHHHFQQKGYSETKIAYAYSVLTIVLGVTCLLFVL